MSDTQQKLAIRTSSKPLATQYDIMFDRDISHANEWHEELYVMRQAVEGDLCNIHINTCGGAVSTISAFQNIKKTSDAHFHGILEGMGYSAGSAFFLMCDTHEVGDFAEMMIHTSQGSGFYTHSQGQEGHGTHVGRTARKLVESVYKDFLTESEIEELLIGKEFWFDSDQIKERLEHRQKIREERLIEESKETYTPEFYAQSVLADITEDCAQFKYDVSEILELIRSGIEEEVQVEEETIHFKEGVFELTIYSGGAICAHDGEFDFTSFVTIQEELRLDDLKGYADLLNVEYPHNIGKDTLAKKLDKKVQEIVDEMNQ